MAAGSEESIETITSHCSEWLHNHTALAQFRSSFSGKLLTLKSALGMPGFPDILVFHPVKYFTQSCCSCSSVLLSSPPCSCLCSPNCWHTVGAWYVGFQCPSIWVIHVSVSFVISLLGFVCSQKTICICQPFKHSYLFKLQSQKPRFSLGF